MLHQLQEGVIGQGAERAAQGGSEGRFVVRVDEDLEEVNDVGDFLLFVEACTRHDEVGNTVVLEGTLIVVYVGKLSEEEGCIAVFGKAKIACFRVFDGMLLGHQSVDAVGDVFGFTLATLFHIAIGIGIENFNGGLVALGTHGFHTVIVFDGIEETRVLKEVINEIKDIGTGAKVLVQRVNMLCFIDFILEHFYLGTAEGIDGLFYIAHNKEVGTFGGFMKETCDLELGVIGVLKFVHKEVGDALGNTSADGGVIMENLAGLQDEIIKVADFALGFVFGEGLINGIKDAYQLDREGSVILFIVRLFFG